MKITYNVLSIEAASFVADRLDPDIILYDGITLCATAQLRKEKPVAKLTDWKIWGLVL